MTLRCCARGLLCVLLTVLAVGPILAETRSANLLKLKLAAFDPLVGAPELPPHLKLQTEPAAGYFVVQFAHRIDPGLLGSLVAVGAEPLKYLPEQSYLVRLPAGAAAAVRGLAGVRWLGPVQPGWKLSPELGRRPLDDPERRADGKLHATADLFRGEDPRRAADEVQALGVELIQILEFGGRARLKLRGTLEQLEQTARIAAVSWIEELGQLTSRNNETRWVIQTNIPDSTTVWDRGLHGEGQIIGHIDGRLDMNSCYFRDEADNTPGPAHRKVVAYRSSTGQGADFHGTHTAGTAAGDQTPINATLDNAGHAYAAKISHGNLGDVTGSGVQPSNLYDFLADAHADGARVHANSWGDDGTTQYTTWSLDIDQFSYDFEDSLVLFAVTNLGSLRTPENAKNVLAVGATNPGTGADSHCTGGVGPTSDGRRKPEIYAPGCGTVSARNSLDCATGSASGTSMACPAVTGAGALVRQYLEEGYYPGGSADAVDSLTPSGALVKAMLLNSTVDMTGVSGYPSNLEGWGRLLLEQALFFDGDSRKTSVLADARNVDGMITAENREHPLVVQGGSERLKVTLVFTEPPAELLAAAATVNDLDLEVRSPSGLLYLGNVIDTASGLSQTGGSPDPINNVEMVILDSPEVGEWTVTVRGSAVNEGTQGFALVATGDIEPFTPGLLRFSERTIQDSPPLGNGDGIVDPGETITMPVTLFNAGDQTASSVSAVLSSNQGQSIKITEETADYPDILVDGTATSLSPHYRYTVAPETPCGSVASFELATLSSLGEGLAAFSVEVGKSRIDQPAVGLPLTLPKKSSSGVSSTLEIADAFTINDVQLLLNVAHGDIGELVVTLTSPQGTTVTVHNRSRAGTADISTTYDRDTQPDGPGTMNDFDGEAAQGTWTLQVIDNVAGRVKPGQLLAWSLELQSPVPLSCSPLSCGDAVPGEVAATFTVTDENATDLRFDWDAVPGASQYRVWRSLAPDFALETLVGQTASTTLVEVGALAQADSYFYRVAGVNSCEWEGP